MTVLRAGRMVAVCGVAAMVAVGCNKKADNTMNYKSAINTYYTAHPACLFESAIKFPVQEETSDATKTAPYDALVDQGLLVRTNGEKKVFIVASKQVNNYDLSDQGRSAWTADPSEPGFGNFCYGHRSVSTIDSATPTSSDPGATTTVAYHYTISGAPGWANAAETKTAFPSVATNLGGPLADTAKLTNTSGGWEVTGGTGHPPATAADGKVVQ
jgi:hypothetical protein